MATREHFWERGESPKGWGIVGGEGQFTICFHKFYLIESSKKPSVGVTIALSRVNVPGTVSLTHLWTRDYRATELSSNCITHLPPMKTPNNKKQKHFFLLGLVFVFL